MMAETEKEIEDLESLQQHVMAINEEDQDPPSPTSTENHKQEVTLIITHTDDSESGTKDGSLSPKSMAGQSVGVQTQTDPQPLFNIIPDDGTLGYDDGVRVLRAIGTWAPEYSGAAQYVDNSSQGFVTGDKNVVPSLLNGKTAVASSTSSSNLTSSTKSSSGDKSFVCQVCHKGLARKDKLVIHMRIHTGEKPYVCEVCDKAFARRDKLVMHMNKLKHLTPSNIAPLGKRNNQGTPIVAITPVKKVDIKPEKPLPISQSESLAHELQVLGQPRHVVAWSCEICGRLCSSRDEWAMHAKSHLTEGDVYLSDRHMCMLCRQEFSSKSDLTFHMRQHLTGKADQLAGLADVNSICS